MKYFSAATFISAILMSGCASTVTTFDASGAMIGKCTAKSGFILGAGATCAGTANQEGKGK